MCFNYSLNTSVKILEERFNAQSNKDHFDPVYHVNAFTFPKMPVITNENINVINFYNWGLIPNWVRTDQKANEIKKFTLNARSETIFEKPSFKNSIQNKRCLIPATGFFEWQHIKKEKIPYYIYLSEKQMFSFAGIWDSYLNESNDEIFSFSIVTCDANPFMANIHNTKKRMPVILDPSEESLWLDKSIKNNVINKLTNKKEIDLSAHTISKILGSPKIDSNTEEILNKYNYNNNTLNF